MSFLTLFGLDVYESSLCVERVPVKVLKRKRWMSDAYHRRVQKKWTKRFGMCEKPAAYTMGNRLMCHPTIYKQLKEKAYLNELCARVASGGLGDWIYEDVASTPIGKFSVQALSAAELSPRLSVRVDASDLLNGLAHAKSAMSTLSTAANTTLTMSDLLIAMQKVEGVMDQHERERVPAEQITALWRGLHSGKIKPP